MFIVAPFNAFFGACRRKAGVLTCLFTLGAGGLDMHPARAADNYRILTGPEIQRLFGGLEEAAFPSDGTGMDTDDWVITFEADGDWEAFTNGADALGTWAVKGDKQCVTIVSNSVASEDDVRRTRTITMPCKSREKPFGAVPATYMCGIQSTQDLWRST